MKPALQQYQKSDKDITIRENYKLISFLNLDAKIQNEILANQINNILRG